MNNQVVRHILFGIFFVLLDVLFFQHLSVFNATADPLLCYLLWIIQKYDRVPILIMVASLALLQDALFDFWGIMMFSKTLTIFLVYNFIRRRSEAQLLLWQIFLIIFMSAIIHNIILFALSSFFSAFATSYSPITIIFGNTLYTALIGLLIYIFKKR